MNTTPIGASIFYLVNDTKWFFSLIANQEPSESDDQQRIAENDTPEAGAKVVDIWNGLLDSQTASAAVSLR